MSDFIRKFWLSEIRRADEAALRASFSGLTRFSAALVDASEGRHLEALRGASLGFAAVASAAAVKHMSGRLRDMIGEGR